MTVGERIAARRKELNMTQEDLAKKLGYKSRSSINKIELSWSKVPLSKLEKVATALECDASYLMGWKETSSEEMELNRQHEEINAIFDSLPPTYRTRFLDFLKTTAQLAKSQDADGESD